MKLRSVMATAATIAAVAAGVAQAEERPEVGQAAPAIELTASDGANRSLGEMRGERSVVVVFFRGLW